MSLDRQQKRTTIYDLAELAGTSASAVSAVLNGNWKKRRISKQLAEKITRIAEEQGYALNMQASLLRREKSHIIGMIVPKYDNRYFGSIVELFETMARDKGLFPLITCTRRDPALEIEAARTMLSYQVDCVIATGATDPDRITELCAAAGVRTINLDLPGKLAPSVISDNFAGARELTRRILASCHQRFGSMEPLMFVGGRGGDHNTMERLRGFRQAHADHGIHLEDHRVIACGYAPEKAQTALQERSASGLPFSRGMFVNSTITLEGVLRWVRLAGPVSEQEFAVGCFDYDPLVALLGDNIEMVRQDVPAMLARMFELIEHGNFEPTVSEIPPVLR